MQFGRLTAGLLAGAVLAVAAPAAAHANDAWDPVAAPSSAGAAVKPDRFRAFTLDQSALRADLSGAGKSKRASAATIVSLPAPDGGLQRFSVKETQIMEAGLAARHPEIHTYSGVGLDDPTASVAADLTSLGFHASVRSASGSWYVEPYYHLDDSVYVSYFTKDVTKDAHGGNPFFERGPEGDPLDIGVGKADSTAALGPQIKLRTYRLALLTDNTYANYFKASENPANVTAAKVTLMNRVDQIYEDETAIRLVLIADNDRLNLDTPADMTGANGPCGAQACFSAAQSTSCGSSTLGRNRIVIGQLVGASNFDIGHIMLGNPGGGIASLQAVGGNNKAQGCTGLATPVGDYMAVDYVAHEMGHQFNGNHTFNGTQRNCAGNNRVAATSVEPGSGTSIMAYAGICDQDNLQPHSDPYWSQRSYDEITAYVTRAPVAVNEVQNVSLRDFDGSDSLTLTFNGQIVGPFTRGVNYSAADIEAALTGGFEVQTVRLTGYDADGESYRLSYKDAASLPIVRGQNNTSAGIAAAIAGGDESQQALLTSFTATTQSFQISFNGNTTPAFGQGGTAISNANILAALNALPGFPAGATVGNAGNGGFTVTWAGASAQTDVAPLSIVNCSGACLASVRENVKGSKPLATWPAGATVTVGPVADSGFTLRFGGTLANTDLDPFSVTDAVGVTGSVDETSKNKPGIVGTGATAAVAGFGAGAFDDGGFQVTFAGTLANLDQPPLGLAVSGGSGFVGETAQGGPSRNQGYIVTDTGNHAPDVTAPAGYTIPPRTPFALTGSATDPDGDTVTYMWEQNDRGGISGGSTAGTALVNQLKTNGPLFRQFGKGVDVSATDTLLYHSPAENAVGINPTRVFPDIDQILANNTNAATGQCPPAPTPATAPVPIPTRECFSEWLPTSDYVGFLGDRTMNFRLTARDGRAGGGGVGSAQTKVTVAPLAGPFRVTSIPSREVIFGTTKRTITWDVAGTDVSPINATNVKISLSTDGGQTYPIVLADRTPNDGSQEITFPQVTAAAARIKVEALGNIFFDVNDADFALVTAPLSSAGGTVPATLSLTLGAPAAFAPFTPGVGKEYTASTVATVVSTAGDGTVSVADPSSTNTGRLVNGAFALATPLSASATSPGGTAASGGPVGGSAAPTSLLTYSGPVTNDKVTVMFTQAIGRNEPLRAGEYSKTLTFTLSTATP